MIKIFTLIFLCIFSTIYAQENCLEMDWYNYKIAEVMGDLNNDGITDRIIVTQDTTRSDVLGDRTEWISQNGVKSTIFERERRAKTFPYKLNVEFGLPDGHPDGSYKLIWSTTVAIIAEYENGSANSVTYYRPAEGNTSCCEETNKFLGVTIENGEFTIQNESKNKGHFEHTFRFSNGVFELTAFSQVLSNKLDTTTINFNLLKGVWLEEKQSCEKDEMLSQTKKEILIRPLPILNNFKPFSTDLY